MFFQAMRATNSDKAATSNQHSTSMFHQLVRPASFPAQVTALAAASRGLAGKAAEALETRRQVLLT